MRKTEFELVSVTESELVSTVVEPKSHTQGRITFGRATGELELVYVLDDEGHRARFPACILGSEEQQKRVFAQFAVIAPSLIPITSWATIMTRSDFESLQVSKRNPAFQSAAWAGLVIAEACIRNRRRASTLTVNHCLGTHSFGTARGAFLWPEVPSTHYSARIREVSEMMGGVGADFEDVPFAVPFIWECLVSSERPIEQLPSNDGVSQALRAILKSGTDAREATALATAFLPLMDGDLRSLANVYVMSPRERLTLYDSFLSKSRGDSGALHVRERAAAYQFATALLALHLSPGDPNISVAQKVLSDFPEVYAWALVLSGINESHVWSGAYEGLGRIVVREITRPFHWEDAPFCDYAVSEASVLIREGSRHPAAQLRLKRPLAQVAIAPGVNVVVPQREQRIPAKEEVPPVSTAAPLDLAGALVDLLWPAFEKKLSGLPAKSKPRTEKKKRE